MSSDIVLIRARRAIFAAAALATASVRADTWFFEPPSSQPIYQWNNSANWRDTNNQSGFPNASGDVAEIDNPNVGAAGLTNGQDFAVTSQICGTLYIGDPGSQQYVYIDNGGESNLDMEDPSGTANIYCCGGFGDLISNLTLLNNCNLSVGVAANGKSTAELDIGFLNGGDNLIVNSALYLDNQATYTGSTTVNYGGALVTSDIQVLPTTTDLIVNSGGSFGLGGIENVQYVNSLSGAGVVGLTAGSLAIQSSSNSVNTQFTGTISGFFGLAMAGAGSLQLTGPNLYKGGTGIGSGTIEAGPLAPGQSGDPLGTGAVTLGGGTLRLVGGTRSDPAEYALAVSGFNQDVVVEHTATNYKSAVTTGFDSTNTSSGYAFQEVGYASTSTGLPQNRNIFSNDNPSVLFTLQPYNGNNVLLLASNANGTLTLSNPGAFSTVSFLAAAANGAATLDGQLNFGDGTTYAFGESVPDWYTNTSYALEANSRISLVDGSIESTPGYPRLFDFNVTVPAADVNKVLTSIEFLNGRSGAAVGIFAISAYGSLVSSTQSYANDVNVTADSSIDVTGSPAATMGNLTLTSSDLFVTGSYGSSLTFLSTTLSGNDIVNAGLAVTVNLGPIGGSGTLTKQGPGSVLLPSGSSIPSVTLGSGTMKLPSTPHGLDQFGTLTISGGANNWSALLDISKTDLVIHNGTLSNLVSQLQQGYNHGTWGGAGGITSSAAAATTNIGIALELNSDGTKTLFSSFDGQAVTSTDILVKYTYFGDTTLDGVVNGSDYTLVDNGFNNKLTGWRNGDFNYDGVVNGDDYTLIDNAFNTQGPSLAAAPGEMIASATAQISSVPEPAVGLTALAAAGLLRRRRGGRLTNSR